jgi:hypothetical protein
MKYTALIVHLKYPVKVGSRMEYKINQNFPQLCGTDCLNFSSSLYEQETKVTATFILGYKLLLTFICVLGPHNYAFQIAQIKKP